MVKNKFINAKSNAKEDLWVENTRTRAKELRKEFIKEARKNPEALKEDKDYYNRLEGRRLMDEYQNRPEVKEKMKKYQEERYKGIKEKEEKELEDIKKQKTNDQQRKFHLKREIEKNMKEEAEKAEKEYMLETDQWKSDTLERGKELEKEKEEELIKPDKHSKDIVEGTGKLKLDNIDELQKYDVEERKKEDLKEYDTISYNTKDVKAEEVEDYMKKHNLEVIESVDYPLVKKSYVKSLSGKPIVNDTELNIKLKPTGHISEEKKEILVKTYGPEVGEQMIDKSDYEFGKKHHFKIRKKRISDE